MDNDFRETLCQLVLFDVAGRGTRHGQIMQICFAVKEAGLEIGMKLRDVGLVGRRGPQTVVDGIAHDDIAAARVMGLSLVDGDDDAEPNKRPAECESGESMETHKNLLCA